MFIWREGQIRDSELDKIPLFRSNQSTDLLTEYYSRIFLCVYKICKYRQIDMYINKAMLY